MHIIMLGAPGSGKGTQAELLKKRLNLPHISSGDLLRNNPNLPEEAKEILRSGRLIPDEMMIAIVKERLSKEEKGWILDGFPRTTNQAEALQSFLKEAPLVLHLQITDEEIANRLTKRRTCPNCNAIYHLTSHPPKEAGLCDLCKTPLIAREDDKPEVVAKRLALYHEKTAPLIEFYQKKGQLLSIDVSGGKSPQAVDELIGEHLIKS